MSRLAACLATSSLVLSCGSSVSVVGEKDVSGPDVSGPCFLESDWRIDQLGGAFSAVEATGEGWSLLGVEAKNGPVLTWTVTDLGDSTPNPAALDVGWAGWIADDEGTILAGHRYKTLVVAAFDPSGEPSWSTEVPAEEDDGVTAVLRDGDDVIVVGGRAPYPSGVEDVFVSRFGPTGEMRWERVLGQSSNVTGDSRQERPAAAFVDGHGDVVVVATRWIGGGHGPLWIFAVDRQGNTRWEWIDSVTSDRATPATTLPSNDGLVVATSTVSPQSVGGGPSRVLRLSGDGELEWTLDLDDGSGDQQLVNAALPTSTGGVLLGGYAAATRGGQLWRVSPGGELEWTRTAIVDGAISEMQPLRDGVVVGGRAHSWDEEGEAWTFAWLDLDGTPRASLEQRWLDARTTFLRGLRSDGADQAVAVGRWSIDSDEGTRTALQLRARCAEL